MEWVIIANLVVSVIMLIVTFTLVLITRKYVLLTGKLVKSTNRPEILVYLRPDEENIFCVNLCVENVGTGTAYNVKFTPNDPSFAPGDDNPLGELGFIKKQIDYWGPKHKVETLLASVLGRQDLFEREPFKIDVTYEDSENTRHDRSFFLDFKQWENVSKVTSNLSKIANAVEKISERK